MYSLFSPRRNIFFGRRRLEHPQGREPGCLLTSAIVSIHTLLFSPWLAVKQNGRGGVHRPPTSHPQLVPLRVAVSELYFTGHGPAFKTLAAAAAAGNALWAVVEGTAINQDGRTVTLTPRARPDPRWSSLPIQIIFFIIICFWYKLSEFPVCPNHCIGVIIFLTAFLITHNRVDEICRKMLRPPFLWFDEMG